MAHESLHCTLTNCQSPPPPPKGGYRCAAHVPATEAEGSHCFQDNKDPLPPPCPVFWSTPLLLQCPRCPTRGRRCPEPGGELVSVQPARDPVCGCVSLRRRPAGDVMVSPQFQPRAAPILHPASESPSGLS